MLEVANLHPTSPAISRNGLYWKLSYQSPKLRDLVFEPSQLRQLTYQCQKYTNGKNPWCQSYLELDVTLLRRTNGKRPWKLRWRYYTTTSDETRQELVDQVTYLLDWFCNNGDTTMITSPAAIREISDALWRSCDQHPWRPIPRALQ